ncbi:glycerophosphodiester phosphodiesterase [Sporolactobacillus terrae]|uniref:Glycerophosphoryl diester phosphodiesterase n=1 Tax=Sporolactobacillus terrae TaxID=269673 RepID=A0A5K7WYX6_9BACL|nr:glycerophosphodiester phosphodiesterase family protein [Sporolactobacillus terrae]BBN99871.1 glycerophosphoryl diester phosphodiesterase [Sporolactobacillus terrae]
MRELFHDQNFPLVGAHRGASAYFPENTLLSFMKAKEMGADYIELDVHLSKDEVPVIMHDAHLDRTTNGKGKLRDFTLAELKQLDAGCKFGKPFPKQEIPTLQEALNWAKGSIGVSIELKQDIEKYPNLEERVLEVIDKTDTLNQIQVMSFNHRSVRRIKELEPKIFAGIILFSELCDPLAVVKQSKADFFNAPWLFQYREAIDALHQEGYLVCGGMNDDPEKWVSMQALGIDMAETNKPDVMINHTQKGKRTSTLLKNFYAKAAL